MQFPGLSSYCSTCSKLESAKRSSLNYETLQHDQ
ncbi:hypothetical protein VULLAG_LOCUS22267 [Vulpes lagopus]